MKKILLFTFLWVLSASYSFAQYSDYKLNSYKTADYNRKLFELELNSSGNVNNSALKSYYEEKQKGHSLSGNFEGAYFQRTNTRKREQSIRLSSNLSGTHSNSKQEYIYGNYYGDPIVHETKRRNYNLGATLYTQNYFYNNNNTFFEISPYVNIQYAGINEESETRDIDSKKFNAAVNSNFGFGVGRLEYIEDARQAVYILEELHKRGVMTKTLSEDEINEMAKIITQIKNKRQFDSRTKLIEEITCIDSFLVANNYIDKTNSATYFTSLYDKWMYGGEPVRLSGSRFKFGVAPHYSFGQDRNSYYDDERIDSEIAGELYFAYDYQKPVKLKLQKYVHATLHGFWGNPRNNSHYTNTYLGVGYGIGYYANTRTYLTSSINQNITWKRERKDYHTLNATTSVIFKGYYYISPQLRFFGDLSINYSFYRWINENWNRYDKSPRIAFNLGLQYSIF